MPRNEQRSRFDDSDRIVLIEQDLDALVTKLDAIESRVGKVMWTMVGILVSVTTACILLAINLAAIGGGS